MKRTKIVATLGPASSEAAIIGKLMDAGVNVFRLNFSHGAHEDHARNIQRIRAEASRRDAPIAILQDLCGPKMRTGKLPEDGVRLETGAVAALFSSGAEPAVPESLARIPVDIPQFAERVAPGARVLINDGLVRLTVQSIAHGAALCLVDAGGVVLSRKGVNLPGGATRIDAITSKDIGDLKMGLEHGVDWVALSFVRGVNDIETLRAHMKQFGRSVPIIAKIEKSEAVEAMDAIVAAADGIMVARGDLGVEVNIEETPLIQKQLIRACLAAGKPVITATQMLESMIENPIPTRAEAADVANAIFDGTDALMLSGETAVGRRPVEVVETMARIAERAENSDEYHQRRQICLRGMPHMAAPAAFGEREASAPVPDMADAIGSAACEIASSIGAVGIVACTMGGTTARRIARYRPPQPLFAVTPNEETYRRLSLTWGTQPILTGMKDDDSDLLEGSVGEVCRRAKLRGPARLVVTAGLPIRVRGITNLIRVMDVPAQESDDSDATSSLP